MGILELAGDFTTICTCRLLVISLRNMGLNMRITQIFLIVTLTFSFLSDAEARKGRRNYESPTQTMIFGENPMFSFQRQLHTAPSSGRTLQMLAHPSGCPRRAFCGCGAATAIFGSPVRSLWLARAWFKFPPSERRPGAVMVRRHHVAILRSHVSGTKWVVEDYNSGGRKSRLHVRDTAGWSIRMPG